MMQRVFAVFAAILLVGAVALATLTPPNEPLGEFVYQIDHGWLDLLQAGVQRYLAPWLWDDLIVPVLLRPAWLLPAAAGIVCTGIAITIGFRQGAARSWRRRS